MASEQKPVPFLSGLALTENQLRILANHHLSTNIVDNIYGGDPMDAMNSTWQDLDKPNSILPLMDAASKDDPYCYLYIIDVVPSFDGQPPKPDFSPKHLRQMWRRLGKPPEWRSVKYVVRRWPRDPGLPEPSWLHARMYSKMKEDEQFCA
ncbi:hypothetical protein D9758_005314 [Tetrapyrgos nigripes]|uniref:Uncharacterized protein n=1 Tax=Tetrapyrgos nigripes TaxID=182062 RepID=A0A8H5GWQ5_9AGAR|nr:hypothetical protein D9758_005314 [Tetrapyrgos nigripes]